jgi:hypothetical protein
MKGIVRKSPCIASITLKFWPRHQDATHGSHAKETWLNHASLIKGYKYSKTCFIHFVKLKQSMFCKKISCSTIGWTMFFYKFWNAMMLIFKFSYINGQTPLSLQKVHSENLSNEKCVFQTQMETQSWKVCTKPNIIWPMFHCRTLKHGVTIEDHKTIGAIDYGRNMSKYVMVKLARRLYNMYIHGNG